jgi:ketosteroid isomerase-like protein
MRYSTSMTSPSLEPIRAAYEALNDGDPASLSSLFMPDAVWRGVERGLLWWRRAPS